MSVSAGSVALARHADSGAEIADRVGVSRQMVSLWRTGASLPRGAARKLLATHYGIPPTAWDRPAMADVQPLPTATDSPSSESAGSTIDLINRRIDLYATIVLDSEMPIGERLKAGELERKCIAERRAIERDARAREADVVARSPQWAVVRKRTLDVLALYPDALRDWSAAMRELALLEDPVADE